MNDQVEFPARKVFIVGTLAIALLFAILVALTLSPIRVGNDTYSYVIPNGAKVRQNAGLPDGTNLPSYLELHVGDSIKVENRDSANHVYSFLVMRPGETVEYKFRTKGIFVGECSIGGHRSVTVRVL